MAEIEISTRLFLDDFRRLNLHLLYRNYAIKLLTGVGIFLMACVILLFFLTKMEQFSIGGFAIGFALAFLMPITSYISAKKNYNSNQRISEIMKYKFDDSEICIEGESFNSTLIWNKVHKVSESKDFILIWQSSQTVNAIPKRDFPTKELKAFAQIVHGISGLKSKLRI